MGPKGQGHFEHEWHEGRKGSVGGDREQRRAQYLQDRTQLLNDRLKGLESRTLTTVRRGMKQKIEDRRILKPVESLRQ